MNGKQQLLLPFIGIIFCKGGLIGKKMFVKKHFKAH